MTAPNALPPVGAPLVGTLLAQATQRPGSAPAGHASPKGSRIPEWLRPEIVDPSDPKGKALIPPWRFEQAAQFLTSRDAPLRGSGDDHNWTITAYWPALQKLGYKPEAVMSSPVKDLVRLDAAFERWRKLPTPLGPVDRLLDKAVNDLVALRKSEFASAAARRERAGEDLSLTLKQNADVRHTDGSLNHYALTRLSNPGTERLMREYWQARSDDIEATDRLRDLSRLLEGQIKTGRVDPWGLMREVPGLRPVLQQVLPAPVPWSR